jgi:hypothetical protein
MGGERGDTGKRKRGWDDEECDRATFRRRKLDEIPEGYRPHAHLAFTTLPAAGAIAAALWAVDAPSAAELLTVPALFVAANFFEWHAHKNLLHRRFRPLAVLYDRHTPIHHRIYRWGDMAMRSDREFKLVLLPAAAVGGVTLMVAPLALGVAKLWSPNAGWLVLAASSAYMLGYELTHLAYHLREDHPVAQNRVIRWLREHHARHHDPRLMQKWNFNVTVPLADWVLGTIASEELLDEIRKKGLARPERSSDDVPAQSTAPDGTPTHGAPIDGGTADGHAT